jgi:hypothetical protein
VQRTPVRYITQKGEPCLLHEPHPMPAMNSCLVSKIISLLIYTACTGKTFWKEPLIVSSEQKVYSRNIVQESDPDPPSDFQILQIFAWTRIISFYVGAVK